MRSSWRLGAVLVSTAVAVTALVSVPAQQASAYDARQTQLVTANPADWTPHVLDGRVNAIVQVGTKVVAGGTFSHDIVQLLDQSLRDRGLQNFHDASRMEDGVRPGVSSPPSPNPRPRAWIPRTPICWASRSRSSITCSKNMRSNWVRRSGAGVRWPVSTRTTRA